VVDMGKEKENEILTGIKRIRRSQILSSFDVVFVILLPILFFLYGYVMTHPEVIIRSDPQFLYVILGVVLVLPLSMWAIGILMDSIKYRLIGWNIFFVYGIFSILSYPLFFSYQNVAETFVWQIYFFFGFGSLFIGFGAGDLFLEKVFLKLFFLPRLKEVGIAKTTIKRRKVPDMILYAFLIAGLILVLVGFLVIPLP